MGFKVFTALTFLNMFFRAKTVDCVDWLVEANVSEKRSIFTFKVEVVRQQSERLYI
jgi:hypothetical protein